LAEQTANPSPEPDASISLPLDGPFELVADLIWLPRDGLFTRYFRQKVAGGYRRVVTLILFMAFGAISIATLWTMPAGINPLWGIGRLIVGELFVMGVVILTLGRVVQAMRPSGMVEQWRTTLFHEGEICNSLAISGARSVFPGILVVAGLEVVAIAAMAQPFAAAWILVVSLAHLVTAIWISTVFVQRCQEMRDDHQLWGASLGEGVIMYAGLLGANLLVSLTCCVFSYGSGNPTLPVLVFLAVDLLGKLLMADRNLKLICQRNRLLPEDA
jgi:hypothetical protein